MISFLSTGKKKAKATRVFGGEVFNDAETSLWYSPSPSKSSKSAIRSSGEAMEENPAPVVLFAENHLEQPNDVLPQKCNEGNDECKENAVSCNGTKSKKSLQTIRDAEMLRLRAAPKPNRRGIAEQTAEAIKSATSIVNQSMNATNRARKELVKGRSKQVKAVRFQRVEERTEGTAFYAKVENNRRQLLAMQRQIASAHFQEKARNQEVERFEKIAELDKEIEFKSQVFRDHQRKLKEERDENRKKSIDARAKIRMNNRSGEEKLEAIRQQEEAAIFDVRADLHRARNEAKKANAAERRKSFQFRAGDAKRIRDIRSKWQHEESSKKQASFELKRAADRDVESYKKQQSQERRVSLQNRNQDARRRRLKDIDDTLASMKKEHESYELKWNGERDAEEYRKKMNEERRHSLAARNKESFRHAQVMEELRTLAIEKETESFMLKFAAEDDAKAYLKKLADERRDSLKIRAQEAKKRRQYDDEKHQHAVESALKEGLLQSECQNDVENYKKATAEKARKSLEFRGKEALVRRIKNENEIRKQLAEAHQGFELDSLARMDVEEYLKDCKKRRRKSLAFRAKEKRRHAEWKIKQREHEIEAHQHSGYLQSLDYQYMALAQQQERARIAIDALRSAGCKIKGNPFADLLGGL